MRGTNENAIAKYCEYYNSVFQLKASFGGIGKSISIVNPIGKEIERVT